MLTYFPEPTTKVNNIEDYDSAFEDESVTGEEKESCSRTTPNNHKSIRKWRQHSHPGGIKNNSSNIKNGHKLINPPTPPTNGFSHPSPFQPISIRTSSSTLINETTHTSIPSPFDIDVHRLSPAGPLSAPSTFNWSNTTSSISHHRPSSTGGSTSSSSGCSSFLSGGPFSPNDSLFASPGSNASSNGNISSLQSLSANSSSSIRERELSLEPDANFYPFSSIVRRQSTQQPQHRSPVFRRTTTTVLTKTETVTSPESTIDEQHSAIVEDPSPVDLPIIQSSRPSIKLSTTSSSSNIPIGIAVARQRTSTTSSSATTNSVERNGLYQTDSAIPSISNVTNNELNVAHNLVKIASERTNVSASITNNVSSEKSRSEGEANGDSVLRSLQVPPPYYSPWSTFPYISSPSNTVTSTSDTHALQSAAAAAALAAHAGYSPLGGYQMAKDPLTGQICFVPSSFSVPPSQPHHILWPPTAIAATLQQLSSASVVAAPPAVPQFPPGYPLGIHPHQHQSYLDQLQRETQLLSAAMARNFSDSTLSSSAGFPPTSINRKLEEDSDSRNNSNDELTQSRPLSALFSTAPSDKDTDKKSKSDVSHTESHTHKQKLQSVRNENHDKFNVKKDPHADDALNHQKISGLQSHEKSQAENLLHLKTKIELTNPQTKQEQKCLNEPSTHEDFDKMIDLRVKCDRLSDDSTSSERSNDDKSKLNLLKSHLKMENHVPLNKDNINKSIDASKPDYNESKQNNPLNLKKRFCALNNPSSTDKNIEKYPNTMCSQVQLMNTDNKSGLDILAEGIERLETRKDSTDSSHLDSTLSSPNSNPIPLYEAVVSPLNILYDAAIYKENEQGRNNLTRDSKFSDISSEEEKLIANGSTGRSRSLDGQTIRKTSRRNSLCIPSEFGRRYGSPKAERYVKAFIASKSKRSLGYNNGCITEGVNDKCDPEILAHNDAIASHGSPSSRDTMERLRADNCGDSPTKIVSWENEMRSNLADIQKKYKEKYKELYKLDHQLKKMEARHKKRLSVGKESEFVTDTTLSPLKPQKHLPKKYVKHDGNGSTKLLNAHPLPPSKSSALPLHPDIIDAQLKQQQKKLKTSPDTLLSSEKNGLKESLHTNDNVSSFSQQLHERPIKGNKDSRDVKKRCGRIVPILNLTPPSSTAQEHSSVANLYKHSATDLSVITSKFKVAKPNPFENLLKLSTKSSSKLKTSNAISSLDEDHENKTMENETTKILKDPEADPIEENVIIPITRPISVKDVVDGNEDMDPASDISIKKTNDRSHYRKRMVETFILKKPKELLQTAPEVARNSSTVSKVEQKQVSSDLVQASKVQNTTSSFPHQTDANIKSNLKLKVKSARKKVSSQHNPPAESSEGLADNSIGSATHRKRKKEKKSKKTKKDKKESKSEKNERKKMRVKVERDQQNFTGISENKRQRTDKARKIETKNGDSKIDAYSCIIKESDLDEGLRVLVKLDGHFYPGKILAISPPDIYGILVDGERGNRPHIFSREEVLKEAIFEAKPESTFELPIGTRVCAYWSGKYRHLFPGTIIEDDDEGSKRERKKEKDQNYMNIELDDGDERSIHIENIRFLPPDYPLVSCDNDPLASVSRRRRRQSIENFKRTEDSRIAVSQRSSIEDVAVEERIAVAKRARYEMEKTEKTPTKHSPSKISASDNKNGTGRLKFTFKTTSSQHTSNKQKEMSSSTTPKPMQHKDHQMQRQQTLTKPVVMHASRSKLTGKNSENRHNPLPKKSVEVCINFKQLKKIFYLTSAYAY